jgi:hypothetical protein
VSQEVHRRIVALVVQAQELAQSVGIPYLLQPGLVKEIIIADLLGHAVLPTKHGADALSSTDPHICYEYLSCLEKGSGQLDRMYKQPAEKRAESMQRIMRNQQIYFAVFYRNQPLDVKVIYEIEPAVLAAEANRKLDRSQNDISHVGFSESWAAKNGKVVYRDPNG